MIAEQNGLVENSHVIHGLVKTLRHRCGRDFKQDHSQQNHFSFKTAHNCDVRSNFRPPRTNNSEGQENYSTSPDRKSSPMPYLHECIFPHVSTKLSDTVGFKLPIASLKLLFMNYYVHHINPIIVQFNDALAIRWYGISYLLGFIACILLLKNWSNKGDFEVPEKEVSNFVVMLALFGVFLGGRLGYVLFYGLNSFLKDPLYAFRVWEGGMASHGGFIGVILFILWYARKHKHSFWNLTDYMAVTTSLGFAFGRLANFINGELWGRITTVKWAVIFPQEAGLHFGQYNRAHIEELINSGTLQPRHPSQLYQAVAEGFLVFGIMLLLRKTAWGRRPGAPSAAYLVLYALARISMECFREPDSTIYFGWLTKGQLYSALMIIGALVIAWKMKLLSKNREQTTN